MEAVSPFFEDADRVRLFQGDCLEVMPGLDGPFDMILADLPYGITALKSSWDVVIPFEPLWEQYKRLIKPNGAVVLFGSQPFTSALVMSNPRWFKYCWVWDKKFAGNFCLAKTRPMQTTEDVCIFSKGTSVYYPQMTRRAEPIKAGGMTQTGIINNKAFIALKKKYEEKYPVNILSYPRTLGRTQHSTEKPVDLLSYLIKTYTQPGELILDNTAGSFSTGVAAVLNGRRFVGIEREEKYCQVGQKRIEAAIQEVDSMLIKPWELDSSPTAKAATSDQMSLFDSV